jgi:hypothetical protein
MIWFANLALAQFEQRVEREFSTGSSPELSITNSFGDINIKTHNSDKIEVVVEINVVPKRERDKDKLEGKVKIDINEQGNRIALRTINNLDGIATEEMDFDYTVKIPVNTTLEIKNQFGDVWIEKTSGKLYARVQHGDLFVGEATGSANSVKVHFGEMRLERISDADLEIQHGDFQCDALSDSQLEIQFSDSEIGMVAGNMEIDVQHSDLRIERVDSATEKLNISAQFSDINLDEGEWNRFNIELEGAFADYSMPSDMKDMINYESKELNTVEYRINKEISDRRITIDANHSDVDFD